MSSAQFSNFHVDADGHIFDCIELGLKIANQYNTTVNFLFNGIPVYIYPNQIAKDIYLDWERRYEEARRKGEV